MLLFGFRDPKGCRPRGGGRITDTILFYIRHQTCKVSVTLDGRELLPIRRPLAPPPEPHTHARQSIHVAHASPFPSIASRILFTYRGGPRSVAINSTDY